MGRLTANIVGSAVVAALALGGAASAAGYLKIGDIKGESTDADHKDWINLDSVSFGTHKPGSGAAARAGSGGAQGSMTLTIGDQDPVAIGLLLPAVQKVREAAARPQSRHVPVATYREVDDDGKVVKTYWLHDVTLKRGVAGAVDVDYACKTWRDERTKRKGGNCEAPAMSKSKGKVDATWKVEEGEK